MTKKKTIDLSSYSHATSSARESSKYSAFIEEEEISAVSVDTPNEASTETTNEVESKTKSINMAFTESNYSVIMAETSRLAINCAYFLNYLIETASISELNEYASNQPMRKGNHASRRKGSPMKRINIKFTPDNHRKLYDCSVRNDITVTTAMNMIIEIYARNNLRTN